MTGNHSTGQPARTRDAGQPAQEFLEAISSLPLPPEGKTRSQTLALPHLASMWTLDAGHWGKQQVTFITEPSASTSFGFFMRLPGTELRSASTVLAEMSPQVPGNSYTVIFKVLLLLLLLFACLCFRRYANFICALKSNNLLMYPNFIIYISIKVSR